MPLFAIGPFEFVSLSRPPSAPMRMTERELRPGSSGVTLWNVGYFTGPFQLLSVRDVANAVDGCLALAQYQAFVGGNPLAMWWAGIYHSDVFIHHVEPLDDGIHQTLLGIGGIEGTSYGLIRATWTLEQRPLNQQP